jgi:FkbM family methyltransferase
MLTHLIDRISRRIAWRYVDKQSRVNILKHQQVCCYSFDHISQYINFDGQYENQELSFIKNNLSQHICGKAILDIGANIGNHSIAFAQIAKQVFSFEPHPITFQLLSLNTSRHKNVRAFNLGASNTTQTLSAFSPLGNMGATSICSDNSNGQNKSEGVVDLQLAPIDELKEISGFEIGFIKIDVEGHEYQALQGLKKTLEKNYPIVALEQLKDEISNGTTSSMDFLKQCNYSFFYELKAKGKSAMLNSLPGIIRMPLKFIQLVFTGKPNEELELARIENLESKDYYMLFASTKDLLAAY